MGGDSTKSRIRQLKLVKPNWTSEDPLASFYTKKTGSALTESDSIISNTVEKESLLSKYWWLIGLVIIVAGLSYKFDLFERGRNEQEPISFSTYWTSGQPSLMKKVSDAAIYNNDLSAQAAIVSEVLKGHEFPKVRSSLIRLAFNPLWEAELTESDRLIILALSLDGISPVDPAGMPALTTAHPAVVFSIIADIPLSPEAKQYADIEISRFVDLPEPIGNSFAELAKLGIASMDNLSARALCHILIGKSSLDALRAYFAGTADEAVNLGKLRLLLGLVNLQKDLDQKLYGFLTSSNTVVKSLIDWFDAKTIADWSRTTPTEKLELAAGMPVSRELSFEQYADLLLFPIQSIRNYAKDKISKVELATSLSFIVSSEHNFSRAQIVSLLSALRLNSSARDSFLVEWFKSNPDASSVLGLLLARRDRDKNDYFNLSAARYVGQHDIELTSQTLRVMAFHPESLVRAQSYSRLDVKNRDDREILREALKHEPNQRLKEELLNRLKGL